MRDVSGVAVGQDHHAAGLAPHAARPAGRHGVEVDGGDGLSPGAGDQGGATVRRHGQTPSVVRDRGPAELRRFAVLADGKADEQARITNRDEDTIGQGEHRRGTSWERDGDLRDDAIGSVVEGERDDAQDAPILVGDEEPVSATGYDARLAGAADGWRVVDELRGIVQRRSVLRGSVLRESVDRRGLLGRTGSCGGGGE